MSYTTDEIMSMTDEEADKALRELGTDDEEEEAQVDDNSDEEETIDEEESEVDDDDDDEEEENNSEEQLDESEEEDNPDEDPEETDDVDSAEESKDDAFDFSKIPDDVMLPEEIAVNGVKVKATLKELKEGFKKGMNYTQKMQELAPHRKSIEAMTENGITQDDINLLIEARKGNKEAIAKLVADSELDALELEPEKAKDYKPNNYIGETEDFAMEEVKTMINSDTENYDRVKEVINTIPDDLYEVVSTDPNLLNALYTDVKNGTYDKVMPEVIKQRTLGNSGISTLQLYSEVFHSMQEEAKKAPSVPDVKEKTVIAKKRKNASMTKTKPTKKKSYVDFKSMDEDEFAKEYEKIMGRKLGAD